MRCAARSEADNFFHLLRVVLSKKNVKENIVKRARHARRHRGRPHCERIAGFLPTQHAARRVLSRNRFDELARLDVPGLPPIPNGVAAAEAPLSGQAVTRYAPRSAVAPAYDALARLLKL